MHLKKLMPSVRLILGCLMVTTYAAAQTDLPGIFTNLSNVLVNIVFPSVWLYMTGSTGWDIYSSRGTVDAVEIPWKRVGFSTALLLGPLALRTTLGM